MLIFQNKITTYLKMKWILIFEVGYKCEKHASGREAFWGDEHFSGATDRAAIVKVTVYCWP